MSENGGKDVNFKRVTNEFLRYSDAFGRSSQIEFWSWFTVFCCYLIIAFGLRATILSDTSSWLVHLFWTLVLIPLVLSLVPLATSIWRRLNDTALVRRNWQNIEAFTQRNKVNKYLPPLLFFALLVVLIYFTFQYTAPIVALVVLFIATLPSDKADRRTIAGKPIAASPFQNSPLPPPPPSLGMPPLPVAQATVANNQQFDSHPRKRLLQRVWFWISVVACLLLLLGVIFPNLQSVIEKEIQSFQASAQAVPEPTAETPTSTPTPTLIEQTPEPVQSEVAESTDTNASESASGDAGTTAVTGDSNSSASLDPRFRTCGDAKASGYGPYVNGKDPEYSWYRDRDGDGIVCE